MKIDNLLEDNSISASTEAGIWPNKTYARWCFSKEFTSTTVAAPQGESPLTTVFSVARNTSSTADVVGILTSAIAGANNGVVFGANFIARNEGGTTNTKLVGVEIDVEPAVGTTDSTDSCGLIYNVFSIASNACVSLAGGIGGTWANGHITSRIRGAHYSVNSGDPTTATCFIDTGNGTFSSAAIKLGKTASQGINFGGGSFGTTPFIYATSGNELTMTMGSSNFIVFQEPGGATRYTFQNTGVLNLAASTGRLQVNSTQVVGPRDTGWTAMTGSSDKATAYATSTVTLAQLAGRVMAIQAALTTHGLLGA